MTFIILFQNGKYGDNNICVIISNPIPLDVLIACSTHWWRNSVHWSRSFQDIWEISRLILARSFDSCRKNIPWRLMFLPFNGGRLTPLRPSYFCDVGEVRLYTLISRAPGWCEPVLQNRLREVWSFWREWPEVKLFPVFTVWQWWIGRSLPRGRMALELTIESDIREWPIVNLLSYLGHITDMLCSQFFITSFLKPSWEGPATRESDNGKQCANVTTCP